MPPAARITDMHTCPMQTPGLPPIPHAGGPGHRSRSTYGIDRQTACGSPWVICAYVRDRRQHHQRIGHSDDWRQACRTHGRHHGTRRRNSRRMPHGTDWRITVKQYKKNNGMSKRNLSRLIFGASLLPLAACLKDEATDGNATEQ